MITIHRVGSSLQACNVEVARGISTGLTPRELEVLAFIAQGLSNAEISERMHWSVRTIKDAGRNAVRKLSSRNRPQAVAKALLIGVLRVSKKKPARQLSPVEIEPTPQVGHRVRGTDLDGVTRIGKLDSFFCWDDKVQKNVRAYVWLDDGTRTVVHTASLRRLEVRRG